MNQLRYRLWNTDDVDAGEVIVDPTHVGAVVESIRRGAYGGNRQVAVIRLADGKEYVVLDDGRKVTTDIWRGKSATRG